MFRSMKQLGTVAHRYSTAALNPNKRLELARQLHAATEHYKQLQKQLSFIPPQGPRDPQEADDLLANQKAKTTVRKNILNLERRLLAAAQRQLKQTNTTVPGLQRMVEQSDPWNPDILKKFEHLAAQCILNRLHHTVLIHARGLTATDVIAAVRANGMRPLLMCQAIDLKTPAALSIPEEDIILVNDYNDAEETQKKVLALQKERGVSIFDPGIGFYSESPEFADFCEKNRILFNGPNGNCLLRIGHKGNAKRFAESMGLNVPETYHTTAADTLESIQQAAKTIGYPVMLKAAFGGGGTGNRLVNNDEELANAFHTLSSHGELILEKYIKNARHIELQLLISKHGALYLGARDCSLQIFFKKLFERGLTDPKLLKKSYEIAMRIKEGFHKMGYGGPATVEFLVDESGNFYFMEVNGRRQVERFLTEEIMQVWIAKMGLDAVIDRLADPNEWADLQDRLKEATLSSEVHTRHVRLNAHNVNYNDGKLYYEGISGNITRVFKPGNIEGGRVELAVQENTQLGHKEQAIDTQFGYVLTRGKTQKEADEKALQLLSEIKVEVDGVEQPCNFKFARFCLQYLIDHPEQKELINTGDFLGKQYIAHCEQQALNEVEASPRLHF